MERTMFSICRQTRDVLCFFLLKSKVTCLSCQPVKTQSLCRSWSKQTGKTWEEIQLGDRLDEPVQCYEQPRTARVGTCDKPINRYFTSIAQRPSCPRVAYLAIGKLQAVSTDSALQLPSQCQ
jgi:hypothetical protein